MPQIDVMYDYNEINKLILSRKPAADDNRTKKIGEALYKKDDEVKDEKQDDNTKS